MSDSDSGTDSDSWLHDAGRALLLFVVLTPIVGPLGGIFEHVAVLVGADELSWIVAPTMIVAPIAGLLAAYEERRYGAVFITGVLTQLLWSILTRATALTDVHVVGNVRILTAELLLYVAALSPALVVVFYVDWDRIRSS